MTTPRWTAEDIPDQTGRTVLITGASGGLGLRTAQALAAKGANVLLACRNPERGAAALREVRGAATPEASVEVIELDVADLASVRACAALVDRTVPHLDVLVNNAGVMALPYRRTVDGFELQLGTNHLGHFALTGLLVPVLERAPAPRVIAVSSAAHRMGRIRLDDLMGEKRYGRWRAYAQSKLANLLFIAELDRRARAAGSPILAAAGHPGYAATHLQSKSAEAKSTGGRLFELGNSLVAQTDEAGARPMLYAATMPDVHGGEYFGPNGLFQTRGYPERVGRSRRARNAAVAAQLWSASEDLTGVDFELGRR